MKDVFILDASVAVKWFFIDEPLRDKAIDVRNLMVEQPDNFIVPSLFYTELIHLLAKKSANDLDFVSRAITNIFRFGIRSVSLSAEGYALTVQQTCNGLSGYDATYVALAAQTKGKWLTADIKATKKLDSRLAILLENFT